MSNDISSAWANCQLANSKSPVPESMAGNIHIKPFGSQEKGDFGILKLDHEKGTADLAFRGSDDLQDWLSNFCGQEVNGKGYHTGFYDGAEQFRDIYKEIPSSYELDVMGHSRGGALGHCAVAQILEDHQDRIIKLFTFGCPKVTVRGSRLYESIASGQVYHETTVNGLDIVPRLPSWLTRAIDGDFKQKEKYERIVTKHNDIGDKPGRWERAVMHYRIAQALRRKDSDNINLRYGTDHSTSKYDVELRNAGLIT